MTDDETTRMVQQKAASCQKLIEDVLEGRSSAREVATNLRNLGALSTEAADYIQQLEQQMHRRASSASLSTLPTEIRNSSFVREATPSGLNEDEITAFRMRREELLEHAVGNEEENERNVSNDVEWAVLQAKLDHLNSLPSSRKPSLSLADIIKALD